MAQLAYAEYLQRIDTWLPQKQFEDLQYRNFDTISVDRVFHRYQASWQFGFRHTLCFIKYAEGQRLPLAGLQAYSTSCYEFVCEHKKEWPAGIFAQVVVVYPLIVTDALADKTRAQVQEYHVRHFARFEFPAVFELEANRLSYCVSAPFYGGALYPVLGKEVESLLGQP